MEISAGENRTPTPSTGRQHAGSQRGQQRRRSSQNNNRPSSVASSVSSRMSGTGGGGGGSSSLQRRTPSRVKFISDEIDEEPSLVEDLFSKNLVLTLEDLDAPPTAQPRKFLKDRKTSILSGYVMFFFGGKLFW